MVPIYYVSEDAQDDGQHEVHRDNCYRLPILRKYLGLHPSCEEAVKHARRTHAGAVGCRLCAYECRSSVSGRA
jgi:hypothetical protein